MSDMSTTDVFFQITNKSSQVNQDITIVDIKDEYNRGRIAQCLSAVDSLKPWVIGVDIIFESIKGEPEDNYNLFQTASNMTSKTVWATKLLDYNPTSQSFIDLSGSFFADSLAVASGFTNLDDNLEKTTIRQMLTEEALNGHNVHSFPVAVAMSLDDSIAIKPTSKLSIDYSTKFMTVAYDSVGNNKDLIKNHIVLIGSTTDESDMWHTPIGKMPGVIVQAYSLNTIRNHSDIKYFSKWTNLLIAFILCYLFEVLIDLGFQRLRRRDSALGHFLIDSKLLLRVATIVFMAIVTWIILLVFVYHSKYIDAVLILAALGILIESRRIYNAAIKALSKNHNWWILKNSLLNNNIFK
jgi:CHASE2 domain-containing sensor protein